MSERYRLGLPAVVLVCLGATGAVAQPPPGERPSHRPLRNDFTDLTSPEDSLAARLSGVRQRGKGAEQEELPPELVALAKSLLKDEAFRKKLQEQKFSPEEIARLRKMLGNREGKLRKDPEFRKLLDEGIANGKLPDEKKKELKKWAEDLARKDGPNGKQGGPDKGAGPQGPGPPPPGPTGPPPPPPERSPVERLEENFSRWTEKNLDGWANRADRWIASPAGDSWRDAFRKAATRLPSGQAEGKLAARARTLSRFLPRLDRALPRNVGSPFPKARGPVLPRVRTSLPSGSLGKGAGVVLLWGMVVLIAAFVLWRMRGWYRDRQEGAGRGWRLGPWPVRPGEVATRGDLVRAFEYLALLRLGPRARPCHHLELADRLGEQAGPSGEGTDRRRQAADQLAHLYEQARYAPEEAPLSERDLATARRELCYLAGATGA